MLHVESMEEKRETVLRDYSAEVEKLVKSAADMEKNNKTLSAEVQKVKKQGKKVQKVVEEKLAPCMDTVKSLERRLQECDEKMEKMVEDSKGCMDLVVDMCEKVHTGQQKLETEVVGVDLEKMEAECTLTSNKISDKLESGCWITSAFISEDDFMVVQSSSILYCLTLVDGGWLAVKDGVEEKGGGSSKLSVLM